MFLASDIRITDETRRAYAMLAATRDMTIGIASTWTGTAKNFVRNRWKAFTERISDERLLARAHRISGGVANGSDGTRAWIAWILRFDTATNCVRRFNVASKARALGIAAAQHGTLGVGATRRRIARVLGEGAQLLGWITFEFWQTEACGYTIVAATTAVRATWIRLAVVTFEN